MNATELKKLIKANNLTQNKLADILKISRFIVNQWCTGKRKIPITRAIKIKSIFAESYKLDSWDFFNFLKEIKKTPEEFATFYGVPVSTVKKWRLGKVSIPPALNLLILLYPHKASVSFSPSIQLRQN